jgi:tRNA 2-thiouridine synthesizing protein A
MNIVPDVKLDVRGERCPYPRIRTLQELKTVKQGQVLEVVATDPEAWQNIDTFITELGDELLGIETKEDAYHIFVRKG